MKTTKYFELNNNNAQNFTVFNTFTNEHEGLKEFEKRKESCELVELDSEDDNYVRVICNK